MYMFTRRGQVQFLEGDGHRGMILARTYKTACKFVRQCLDSQTTVAKIGTIPGETLETLITASLVRGEADCAFVIESIKKDRFILSVH